MEQSIKNKLDEFFTQYKRQTFKPGEFIIRADEDPQGVYYLTAGNVRMYAISRNGDELVLNIFKPLSFFPMNWAVNDSQNNYYFEASSEVETWRAPRHAVIEFVKKNPDVLFDLLSRVYKGTDGMLSRMMYLMTGGAYLKLIIELIIYGKRFGKRLESNEIEITITEKSLAAQSGLTRETVSRELHKLREKRLVNFSKNLLTIVNLENLEEELLSVS